MHLATLKAPFWILLNAFCPTLQASMLDYTLPTRPSVEAVWNHGLVIEQNYNKHFWAGLGRAQIMRDINTSQYISLPTSFKLSDPGIEKGSPERSAVCRTLGQMLSALPASKWSISLDDLFVVFTRLFALQIATHQSLLRANHFHSFPIIATPRMDFDFEWFLFNHDDFIWFL